MAVLTFHLYHKRGAFVSLPIYIYMKRSGLFKMVRILLLLVLIILIVGYCWTGKQVMPVKGADIKSYAANSFWFYPWGKSVTHKGVDIFARKGTDVVSATGGIVVFSGVKERGGNAVVVLGPRWRFHYYAHLDQINTRKFSVVSAGAKIGTVGNTGNAAGKPSHLHYSIARMIPEPWKADKDHQGWKKMIYLNPIPLLDQAVKGAE